MDGAEFIGRLARRVGRLVRRAAPILGRVGRVAAPVVAAAIVLRSFRRRR